MHRVVANSRERAPPRLVLLEFAELLNREHPTRVRAAVLLIVSAWMAPLRLTEDPMAPHSEMVAFTAVKREDSQETAPP